MKSLEELASLPLTETEEKLKRVAPFPFGKPWYILTSTELLDYLIQMKKNYGTDQDDYSPDTASDYSTQREVRYITKGNDISVGRMLRYMPAHWHDNEYFELYYAFSGECPILFDHETILLKPGMVLLIAPSVSHASPCYSDDCVLFYYMIRSSTFDRVFWEQLSTNNLMSAFFRQALNHQNAVSYLFFDTEHDFDLHHILYQIYQEYTQQEIYHPQLMNALMSSFFLLLLRRYEKNMQLPQGNRLYWKPQFSTIFAYIQKHYDSVTLKSVAQEFHYSERQLGRIIQTCTGSSFGQMIFRIRMEKASEFLVLNTYSIDEIASRVGYSTTSSFYRAFTSYYGCTPAAYQKEQRA